MFIISNITEQLDKLSLTESIYEACLQDIRDKVNGNNDMDWSEVVSKYHLPLHPDSVRKASSSVFGGVFVADYIKSKAITDTNDTDYIKELQEKKQELEREKIKLSDERKELNKSFRRDARVENKLDILEEVIKKNSERLYPIIEPVICMESNNDMIVMLSDLHIGATYGTLSGFYNSNVAKERLQRYLSEVIDTQSRYNAKNCYVSLQGDMISNSIHKNLAVSNRENVIEQIMLVSEMVSDFIYELSKHFEFVQVTSVCGNHSRIDRKEDAIHNERLDEIVPWFVRTKLSHIDNICIPETRLDTSINSFFVRDKVYVSVHGDFDSFTDSSVAKLVMFLGFKPYCILFGHKHYPAMSEVSGVKIVQGGSLAGSGDEFTIEHRLCGHPSQTILVCNETGIIAHCPVDLL